MDRRVTPPKRVTSPTWGSPPPCNKQALSVGQPTIECFHSRGQHLYKFIGTKESVCIIKEFNSHRTGLGHQYGRRDVMCKHSMESGWSHENSCLRLA